MGATQRHVPQLLLHLGRRHLEHHGPTDGPTDVPTGAPDWVPHPVSTACCSAVTFGESAVYMWFVWQHVADYIE